MKDQMDIYNEIIDPQVEELLALLRTVPDRDREAEMAGLHRLISEIEGERDYSTHFQPFLGWWESNFIPFKERIYMNATRRPAMAIIALIVAVMVFLFGGAGITAYASRNALPGDALYGVKTRLESARVSLQNDLAIQARMHLDLAQTRLDEISALIQAGRFTDIPQAVESFNTQVQMTLKAVAELSLTQPEKAAELNLDVTRTLAEFSQKLTSMLATIPDPVRVDVNPQIPNTQSAEDENTNLNSNEADENANEDVNENEDNDNDDDGNENDDEDEDENENDDDANENDDDNSNLNSNDNDDDDDDDDGDEDDDDDDDDDDEDHSGPGGGGGEDDD